MNTKYNEGACTYIYIYKVNMNEYYYIYILRAVVHTIIRAIIYVYTHTPIHQYMLLKHVLN